MKTKHIILVLIGLFLSINTDAQIFKKLKEKANKALGIESHEESLTFGNSALQINTDAKKAFYKEDVVIEMFENNKLTQTQYFDKDEIAVRIEDEKIVKSGYNDSEGFIYAYNKKTDQYEKLSIVALQSQGMMAPTMMLEAYKLPPEPFMASLEKHTNQGLTPNPFNGIVEFSSIYKPENFRHNDFKESKLKSNGKTYTKFDFYNQAGHEGSYVLFDDKNRLVEIYTNKSTTSQPSEGFSMDMMPLGESRIKYDYKPVDVKLPPAKEVKMAGQGMMEMIFGSFKIDKNNGNSDDDDYDTSKSKGMVKSIKKSLKNNKITNDMLPESYDFDYVYKTTFVQNSKKSNAMDMNFLVNTKNANYNGAEYILKEKKAQGKSIMIFDLDLNAMVMFMEYDNQKMLQIHSIPEVKDINNQVDFTIKELPSKTILGFKCTVLQLENEKHIIKAYHTKNAPISLSNFFGFSGSKGSKNLNLPDMKPRLLKQFENSLVMEMQYEDKKRKKNNFVITAKSLEKEPTKIKKTEYESMNMFSAGNMFKN